MSTIEHETETELTTKTVAATERLPECITRDNLTSAWFPSIRAATLYAIVALCAVFLLTSFNRLNHTDLWGHLNFGRWIVRHEAFPAFDPFAAEPSSIPALQSAWLSQVIGYEVQQTFGNEGLALGHALLVTLTAAVLMLALAYRGLPRAWLWTVPLAMFVLDLPIVGTLRPQLFGQLGAALVLLACAQLPKYKHPLVWLPLVMLAWANLHGSMLMGLLMLAIYTAGIAWNAYVEGKHDPAAIARDRRVWWVSLALGLSLAATFINPHGPALLGRAIYFGENPILTQISEWRSLTPNSLTGVLMILSVGAFALVYKSSGRRWEAYELLLLVAFVLATLSAIRMLAWWALVWPFVVLPHAAAAWEKFRARVNETSPSSAAEADQPQAMRTVIALGFVYMTVLMAPPTFSLISGQSRGEGPILVTDTPLYITEEVVRRQLTGNFAAPMDWADFVVWKTDGQLKPLIYSHVHLADPTAWDDYVHTFIGDETWLQTCRTRQIRYLLVSKRNNRELAKRVLTEERAASGKVRLLYQDQKSLLVEVLPARAKAENKTASLVK
jgi:hypothetical protein